MSKRKLTTFHAGGTGTHQILPGPTATEEARRLRREAERVIREHGGESDAGAIARELVRAIGGWGVASEHGNIDAATSWAVDMDHTHERLRAALNAKKPHWDAERGMLTFGRKECLRITGPAINQPALLDAFERAGWPPRIENPFPAHAVKQTRTDMNRTLRKNGAPLRFGGGRKGYVQWSLA